jgi:hypothetical protein
MKILLVETSPIRLNIDVTVHVRNAVVIENYLKSKGHDCHLISLEDEIVDVHEQFDFIVFFSATFYFPFQRFVQLMDNQKHCKIGWITNEFELFANDFLKGRMDFIIANFEEWGVKKAHTHNQFLMTNLNALIAQERNGDLYKKYDMCYYGTYRKYRDRYFEKYFQENFILSTSRKNLKKFRLLNCDCLVTDKFSWIAGRETLNLFRSTLYIEDIKTHKLFNYMANRFFESLYCNSAVFFDTSCKNTIEKDVYEIDDYFIVDGYEELMNKSRNINQKKLNSFLSVNSKIALQEKEKTLKSIEEFLLNLL